MADNALIDKVELAVGARTVDCARIPDFVAQFELTDSIAKANHFANGIPAQNTWGLGSRSAVLADFVIDWIDRHGGNFDQNIMARRGGRCEVQINQRIVAINRALLCIANGFHGTSPRNGDKARACALFS